MAMMPIRADVWLVDLGMVEKVRSCLAGSSEIFVAAVQGAGFGGIAAMSEVGMRATADKLDRVLCRQTPTEDTKHPRRIAGQAIPRQVAPQSPQVTSDRMIPRNRHLGYFQLRRLVPLWDFAWWLLESRARFRFTGHRTAYFIHHSDIAAMP